MQGRASIHVFGSCIGPEFLKKSFGEIGVSFSRGPVKSGHFELINIKGEIGVGFK